MFLGAIKALRFDSSGKLVLTCGDRHVRIFHNMAHYAATVLVGEAKLKQPGLSTAIKERLTELVTSAKKFLSEHRLN